MLLIYINNYSIAIAWLWIIASEYSIFFIINVYIFKTKYLIKFLNIYFFLKISDTEYRKLLSGSYEYEYEEYPDQDNYGSNNPQDTKTTSIGSTKKRLHLGQRHIQPLKLSLQKKYTK